MANWIWKKYKADAKYLYREVSRDDYDASISNGSTLYATKTFNPSTGLFTLSGEEQINTYNQQTTYTYLDDTIVYYDSTKDPITVPKVIEFYGRYSEKVYTAERYFAGYVKGSYIGEVVAPESAYTNNARNSDGYWYVKDRLANQAPSISGVDEDLGIKNKAFQVSFKVNDGDLTQSLTVTTRLNGTQISEYLNATRDQDYIIDITDEMLKGLELNKKNTINVTVSDGTVTTNRNFYFTRTNQAPVISVGNSNFGEQNKEFEFIFSATDPDGDAMTAKVYIDGVQVEDIGAVVDGHENTYKIKREDFIVLKNGEHKIRIDITDTVGSASSSFITFTKKVTWYLYEYKEELPSQPTDIRVDMLANLAEGIERKIEVCNNALDTKPTWETIEEGKWLKFTNSKKTAEKWGLGVRVRVDRGTATQDSYVYGFNISYV